MLEGIEALRPIIGLRKACQALGFPRATWQRRMSPATTAQPKQRFRVNQDLCLEPAARKRFLELAHSRELADKAPPQIYFTPLDAGDFICSVRTMYRILAAEQELKERRNQLRHPIYKRPELLATGPNQLWSWDITKLRGHRLGLTVFGDGPRQCVLQNRQPLVVEGLEVDDKTRVVVDPADHLGRNELAVDLHLGPVENVALPVMPCSA